MGDITLEKDCYDNALLCPECGGNNLHHGAVTKYSGTEDAEHIRVTRAEGDVFSSIITPRIASGNPSSRRGGIVLEFWCENCHGEWGGRPAHHIHNFRLQIQQHKGTTYLDWDIPSK
jgi:hypothetical protein